MSWAERKINELGDIVTGKTPSTKVLEYFGGEYPFVTPSDIDYGHYYVRITEITVTEQAKNKHKNQFIPKDSVLFTCIGNTMGKCAIASQECISNQQINSVVANDEHDPKFLYYLLHHNRNLVRGIGMGGGAATPIINKTTFGNIKLKVPTDKAEQEAISSLLEKYDDLIENNKRRIELLEESARQLYREWFVRFRFPGHEHVKIIDGVPEGWSKGCVSDLGKVVTGKTPSTKVKENFGGEIPFIKTPDMHASSIITEPEEYLSERGANCQANKYLPKFSILVACIGARLGVVSLNARRCQTNQQINAVIPKSEIYTFYSYLTLKGFREKLLAIGGGATMPNVNKSKFSGMEVLLPSESLLESFHDVVDQTFFQMEKLIEMNSKLTQARDLLLPKLMSGEIAL
ncbi:restriction endonuclease subunit S [Zooshikella sp. RANM57]|uniref:restriction endonuclease subunit S n=1 Tax=Zooshikella sp. RANM57 TaxID=3425863 RepID=UPI003D6E3596